jgi:hypothetical protein
MDAHVKTFFFLLSDLITIIVYYRSRNSSASVATGYGVHGYGSIPGRSKCSSLLLKV